MRKALIGFQIRAIKGVFSIFEKSHLNETREIQVFCRKKLMYFEFFSIGPRGKIKKIIEFSETNVKDVYNLAFGDFDEKTQQISDIVVTNNGDSLKVLATVASSVYAFTTKRPEARVFATGSTAVRTRLYRMGLTNNLAEISKDFDVYGLKEDQWEDLLIGDDYEAFLVKRK